MLEMFNFFCCIDDDSYFDTKQQLKLKKKLYTKTSEHINRREKKLKSNINSRFLFKQNVNIERLANIYLIKFEIVE